MILSLLLCRRDKYSGYNEAQYKRCIEQCFQEIIFLNRLKSEFIIPILAYSDSPDPCIVYQFMPNGSLLDRYCTLYSNMEPALSHRVLTPPPPPPPKPVTAGRNHSNK
jgi:hypothetical protein